MTFGEFATRFLALKRATKAPTTYLRYESVYRCHLQEPLAATPLVEVMTTDTIEDFLTAMLNRGCSVDTTYSTLQLFQSMGAELVAKRLAPMNPTFGITKRLGLLRRRKQRRRKVVLVPSDLQRYLAAAWARYPQLAPLYEVYAYAAVRPGEGLGLQWADVEPGRLRIRRTWTAAAVRFLRRTQPHFDPHSTQTSERMRQKSQKAEAIVTIGPHLEGVLTRHRETVRGPWCFPSPRTGLPWDIAHVEAVCGRLAAALGLHHVHPHLFRHTWAANALRSGERLEWISGQLRHATLEQTREYAQHLDEGDPDATHRAERYLRDVQAGLIDATARRRLDDTAAIGIEGRRARVSRLSDFAATRRRVR